MEKRNYNERPSNEERSRRERFRDDRFRDDRHRGKERFHREGPQRQHCDKPHFKHSRRRPIIKTKMFMDKTEMVEFINEKGEKGHRIEVFKIEDGLYKVEVRELPSKQDIEIDVKE